MDPLMQFRLAEGISQIASEDPAERADL